MAKVLISTVYSMDSIVLCATKLSVDRIYLLVDSKPDVVQSKTVKDIESSLGKALEVKTKKVSVYDIVSIAKACGYKAAFAAEVENELLEKIHTLKETAGPVLLEVRINTGSRKDLGRPTIDPKESKKAFTKFLQDND